MGGAFILETKKHGIWERGYGREVGIESGSSELLVGIFIFGKDFVVVWVGCRLLSNRSVCLT